MSTSGIERVDGRWIVSKRCAHQWKLRDRRANAILDRRFGPTWGEVIAHKPALGSPSRSRAEVHGESSTLPETISVPDRWLRRYRSPVCYARKRVRLGEFWLPDTFRSVGMRVLGHRALNSASAVMARMPNPAEVPIRRAEGAFYYFDSEYFSHFGHVLTDAVATPGAGSWPASGRRSSSAGESARRAGRRARLPAADLRCSRHRSGHDRLRTARLWPRGRRAVRRHGGLLQPALRGSRTRRGLERIRRQVSGQRDLGVAGGGTPSRLFVGREPRDTRTCRNADEVEALFTDLGFTVIHPEQLDFAEQVAVYYPGRDHRRLRRQRDAQRDVLPAEHAAGDHGNELPGDQRVPHQGRERRRCSLLLRSVGYRPARSAGSPGRRSAPTSRSTSLATGR